MWLISVVLIGALALLLVAGLWIALTLLGVGWIAMTLFTDSLAGAGTLGLLIPPSIIMIVYGVAADVSIARLFVAGVLPGVMLMLLFSGYIAAWALLNPARTPPRESVTSLGEKIFAARHLIP